MDVCHLATIFFFSACELLAIDKSLTPITLVLAEDGTIVDDDDYFLCLPSNTKFVALACNEKWIYNDSGKKCRLCSQEPCQLDGLRRPVAAVCLAV
jgi:DNA fragmentation factor alpha subunit